jgi:hypothetical protein
VIKKEAMGLGDRTDVEYARPLSLAMLLVVTLCGGSNPANAVCSPQNEVVISQSGRGWFEDTGRHVDNKNTFAGQDGVDGGTKSRAFFIFDLSGLPLIGDARLRLELENYFSPDPSETFDVFDVSALADDLRREHPEGSLEGIAIFSDLGSGNRYSPGIEVTRQDRGTVLNIPLNPQAVEDINTKLGGPFAVGIRVRGPFTLSAGDEGVRFSYGDESRVHELVLVPAALPAAPTTWGRIKELFR